MIDPTGALDTLLELPSITTNYLILIILYLGTVVPI